MTSPEETCWRYIVANPTALAYDVSLNCDVAETYAQALIDRIGTPAEVLHAAPTRLAEGVKHDEGKARYDLIPPELEEAIAMVLSFGAAKYGDARNWEKGMRWGRPYAAMRRHMAAWWKGEDRDAESGMPHTWHAASCLAFIVAFEARGSGTDDRP
tara:strand:- start:357 stop:824 length:468 start_codon:yes stop_codon:yes gene_type:complete